MPSSVTLNKPIVLVGMMGAGKTAIGKAVAQRLGVDFVDSDSEMEQASNMTIAEIFERDGESFFRKRETEIIGRLVEGLPRVIATGGGAYLNEANRDLINGNAASVWLKADLELLWSRVRHKTTRPLLRTDDPYGTLKTLFEQRDPIYAQAALHVTAKPEYAIEDMCEKVVEALRVAGHLLDGRTDAIQKIETKADN